MTKAHDVLIIGAGFAGLAMAIGLEREGFGDFLVLEKDDGVGGTWRANRYPGCACDVESHLYSLSYELNPGWTHMFACQKEILAYLERTTDKFGLRSRMRFGTAVVRAAYDERTRLWEVETDGGQRLRTRVLVSGTG